MVNVQLPSQLSNLAAGRKRVDLEASTLGEVFRKLDETAPMIRSQIFDATGAIRATWCADDPLPNDGPGLTLPDCTSRKFVSSDLDLQPTAGELAQANAAIAAALQSSEHLNYRALQARTNNPAQWITANAKVENGKIVKK